MKKLIVTLLFILIMFNTNRVNAELAVHSNSASITAGLPEGNVVSNKDILVKKIVLSKILTKYNSPLISDIDTFIDVSLKNNLNMYLLPSIAGLESGFGKKIYKNSFNPFGWGGGYMVFNSFNQSITTVGSGLKTKYIDKGIKSIEDIGRIYAPPSSTWSYKVNYFISQFEQEEQNILKVINLL